MVRIGDDHFQASSFASLAASSSSRPLLSGQPPPAPSGPLAQASELARRSFSAKALPGIIALDHEQQAQQASSLFI